MLTDPTTTYQPLDVGQIAAYVHEQPALRGLIAAGALQVDEVGDGNLNQVFVIRDDPARPGLVLKQSLPWVRVHGRSWPLTLERARREAHAYEIYQRFATEFIPRYHGFDGERYVIAMEDLADLRVWRTALNAGELHAGAAEAMGAFVARIAFHTSDFGLPPEERKLQAAASVNPELCRITEDLVLSEPYTEHEHNWHHPTLQALADDLRADADVHREIGMLKHRFLTHAEALIHGDLHTGSVMVGGGRVVAIDPEFAFYGPIGFDLGALWANAIIAAARADRLERDATFRAYVEAILPASWSAFRAELERLWPQRLDRFYTDAFLERWVAHVWRDGLGYAAAEAIRRMIGYAHVSDIETLEEPARSSAAAAVLRAARGLLLERDRIDTPADAWARIADELARSR